MQQFRRRKFLRIGLERGCDVDAASLHQRTFFALNALAAEEITQTVTGKGDTILVVLQLAGATMA